MEHRETRVTDAMALRAEDDGAGLTLRGYATVFDADYEITDAPTTDTQRGAAGRRFAAGALGEVGDGPRRRRPDVVRVPGGQAGVGRRLHRPDDSRGATVRCVGGDIPGEPGDECEPARGGVAARGGQPARRRRPGHGAPPAARRAGHAPGHDVAPSARRGTVPLNPRGAQASGEPPTRSANPPPSGAFAMPLGTPLQLIQKWR